MEYLGQFLGGDLIPIKGLFVRIQKRRHVPHPLLGCVHRLAADHTGLAGIPVGDDASNQSALRRYFDLFQTFLAASLPFRPARTLAQAKLRCAEYRILRQMQGV